MTHALAELLEQMAAVIANQAALIEQQATDLRRVEEQHEQAKEMAQRSNEVLLELVQVVDPAIMQGGQANMHDLTARVRELVALSRLTRNKGLVDVPLPDPTEEEE